MSALGDLPCGAAHPDLGVGCVLPQRHAHEHAWFSGGEFLQWPAEQTVHDGTGPVDGVTRCCGVRMTDLPSTDRVTTFASQVTCPAPTAPPATAIEVQP